MAIDVAFRVQFQNDFELKFQQMGSRLRPFVTERPQTAERKAYDRIGTVTVAEKTTRHAPTTLTDADHTRVSCFISDWRPEALAFDDEDKLRMELNDPRMEYAQTQAMALGRKLDEVIIAAATGTTYTGKNGTTAETYDATTYGVAVNAVQPGDVAVNSNLTIEKLIQAKSLFGRQESVMDGEPLVCVVSQRQLDALLRKTETTSADFNTVRALASGTLDTFMGFKFIRTELLTYSSTNVRRCLAFPKSAIILGMAESLKSRIDERSDLNYTWQVWTQGTFGAVRTWREKVVSIDCDETAA